MKKSLLILVILLNSFFLYSQLLSRKLYQYEGQNRVGEMVLTNDGNLILPVAYSMTVQKTHILKTDLTGEIIWEKTYDWNGSFFFFQIIEIPSGDFFMCGGYHSPHSREFLIKLNPAGDSLYSVLGNQSSSIESYRESVLYLNDETLFSLTGSSPIYYPNPGWVSGYIIDTLGNHLKTLGMFDTHLHNVAVLTDSVVIWNMWNLNGTSAIFQYSLKDSSLTSNYLDFYVSDFKKNSDGSFYFSLADNKYNSLSGYDIAKYNEQGEVEWITDFDEENADTVCRAERLQLYNDKIIVVGYMNKASSGFYPWKLFIATTDTSGQLQSFYTNNDFAQQVPVSMKIVDDKLLIYGVYKNESNDPYNPFLDVYSLDSLMTSVNKPARKKTEVLTVFPNPTSGIVKVLCNTTENSTNKLLTVYDLNGVKVKERKISAKNGPYEFDLSNYGRGVYLLRLTINGKIAGSYKVIVR